MQNERNLRRKLNEIRGMLDSASYLKSYFTNLRDQIDYVMGDVELIYALFYR